METSSYHTIALKSCLKGDTMAAKEVLPLMRYDFDKVMLQDGTVHDPEAGHCFQRMCVPCARSVLITACQRIAVAFRDVT